MLQDETGNVTLNATGACAGGDTLVWQGAIDEGASDTGIESIAVVVGVKMEYTSDIGD
jgi:hypothetical protein